VLYTPVKGFYDIIAVSASQVLDTLFLGLLDEFAEICAV